MKLLTKLVTVISAINMRIKNTQEVSSLAARSGNKDMSKQLVSELLTRGIIEDISDNYGYNIFESINRDVRVSEIVDVLHVIGINDVKSDDMENLFNLVLMGDGDCPYCGGELVIDDEQYASCGGDGYLTPFESEPIYQEGHCKNCDYTF